MCWWCLCCLDFLWFEFEEKDPNSYYMEIVKNRSIDSAKQLNPPLTENEKKDLLKIMDNVSSKAREIIISNCVDSGAGTGISLVQMDQ